MLQIWKNIILNWINCYFIESVEKEQSVSVESLLAIISHLRKSLNLHESKSSILEALSIEEFLFEKYPQFKFENGSLEPSNEDDFYIVASLLLYFVCTNSKDLDIKNAMCSKLSSQDQEVILKYSKNLMEVQQVQYKDVHAAIIEACQELAIGCPAPRSIISDTPPALRSLHSEVRRLQAALDAERFDRTFLQDELARNNLRLEKLIKDKEQYKLEILNLKAKISWCCGEEKIPPSQSGDSKSNKLLKQIQDLEERLVHTQEQLEEVQYDRDSYKAKMIELKQEREKLQLLNQESVTQIDQLQEELNTEKRLSQSYKELLYELRIHNQRNFMDNSQLEWDDLEISINSLPHNASNTSGDVVKTNLSNDETMTLKEELHSKLIIEIEQMKAQNNHINALLKQELERYEQSYEEHLLEKQQMLRKYNELNEIKDEIESKLKSRNILVDELQANIKGKKEQIENLNNDVALLNNVIKKQNDTFKQTVDNLNIEIEKLTKNEHHLQETIENYRSDTESKLLHIQTLTEQLTQKDIAKTNLEKEIKFLNQELINLRKEQSLKDFQLEKLRDEYNNLQETLNKQIQQLQIDYEIKLHEVDSKFSILKDQQSIIENELDGKNSEMLKLLQKIEQNNSEILLLKKNLEILTNNLEKCSSELRNKDETIGKLKIEINDLKKGIENENKERHTVEKLNVKLEHENKIIKDLFETEKKMSYKIIEEKEKLIEKISEELKQKKNTIETVKKGNHELSEALNHELKKKESIAKEKEELGHENKILLELLESVKTSASSSIDEKQSEINKLLSDMVQKATVISRMEQEKHELHSVINKQLQEIAAYDKRVFELDSENNMLKDLVETEKNTLKNVVNEIESKVTDHLKNINQKDEVLKILTLENQKLNDDIAKHIEQNRAIKEENNDLKGKVRSLRNIIQENNSHIQRIVQELSDTKYDKQQLESNINLLNEELMQTKEEISVKVAQKKDLEYEKKKLEDNEKVISNNLTILESSQSDLTNSIERLEIEMTAKINRLTLKLNETCLAKEELKSLLNDKVKECSELKKDIKALNNENEHKSKQIKELEDNLNTVVDRSNKVQEQNERLKTKIKVQMDELNEISLLRDKLQHSLTENKQKESAYEMDNKIFIQTISDLKASNETLQEEKKGSVEQLNKLITMLDEKLLQKDKVSSNLQNDNMDLRATVDAVNTVIIKLGNEIDKHKQLLEQSQNENDILNNKCLTLEKSQLNTLFELQELSSATGELREVLNEKDNEIEKLKVRIASVSSTISDKDNMIQQISNNTVIISEQLSKEIEIQAKDQKALQEQIKTLTNSLQTTQKCYELTVAEKDIERENIIKELQKVTVEKDNLLQHLKNVNENLSIFNKLLHSKVAASATHIENKNKIMEDLQKIQEINKSEIRENIETLTFSLHVRENILKETLCKNKTLASQLEAIVQEKQMLLTNLLEVTNESNIKINDVINTKDTAIEKCMNEISEKAIAIRELNETQDEIKIKLDSEIKTLSVLLQYNESMYATSLLEKQTVLNNMNEQISKVRNENAQLKTDIEKLDKEILTLSEELSSKESVIESLVNDKNHKENTIQEKYNKEVKALTELYETTKSSYEMKIKEKEAELRNLSDQLTKVNRKLQADLEKASNESVALSKQLSSKATDIESLVNDNNDKEHIIQELKKEISSLESFNEELKIKRDSLEIEMFNKIEDFNKALFEKDDTIKNLEVINEQCKCCINNLKEQIKLSDDHLVDVKANYDNLEIERNELICNLEDLRKDSDIKINELNNEIGKLKLANEECAKIIEDNKSVVTNLEQLLKHELEQNEKLREEFSVEKMFYVNKCSELEKYQTKSEKNIDEKEREISELKANCEEKFKEADMLKEEVKRVTEMLNSQKEQLNDKDNIIIKLAQEKDAVIGAMSKELLEEKETKEKIKNELETKNVAVYELRQKISELINEEDVNCLRKENDELIKAMGQRETLIMASQEKSSSKSGHSEKQQRLYFQVYNNSPFDNTQSSLDSYKTISDLEKIIHDKNRTITTLRSDLTYMKSLMAESENKLLDVNKELEITKENCDQLSIQLKKIVNQKNDEIADLKKQLNKMSFTENRASEIIKLSAKYQAIILKRIAEIKTNTVLKELQNFGNSASSDHDLRRGLNTGSITMDDLENFLETTEKNLKRFSEKQIALQKERDRLYEVSRINESEIISLKKFLTELSVSFKTFSSVKEIYTQKLSKVVSIQRTVRREILNSEGHITDAAMCKLERGYAAVMQDLAETVMNVERWVERSLGRTISPEKIKQAFTSEVDRASLSSSSYQNAGLEVQLEELEKSFQKLLDEVSQARRGEGSKDTQSVTVMEVRAEYEDKLNRMKAKMKQLFEEQIAKFKEKQKKEIADLNVELHKAKENLAESSRAYEEHIRALTTELWSVGEKFLIQKDEAEWLRRKQRSGSLMSLQHYHSSGLGVAVEEPSQPSDSASLRSLPVTSCNKENKPKKRDGRGLHMSDEEGEVFDNRCLKELTSTPRAPLNPGKRLSELQWRNSLCPPHLKSSYPAETQFAPSVHEEDIKHSLGPSATLPGRNQRKEVGITAYKKPGPPTPSKQAGRLSATDSELRESLRVEMDPHASRKTNTPSRLRALFRSSRNDTSEMTPRRRLSNMFRKK